MWRRETESRIVAIHGEFLVKTIFSVCYNITNLSIEICLLITKTCCNDREMGCAAIEVHDLLTMKTAGQKRGNICSKKHFAFLPARCLKCFRNYCLQNAKIWTSWWLICCFRTKPKYLEIGPRKKETFITKISSMLSMVLWNFFFFFFYFRSNFCVHETDQPRFLQMAADHVSGSRPTRKKKRKCERRKESELKTSTAVV